MSTTVEQTASRSATGDPVPPLENGDVLTRAEFYRRWEAMPQVKRAERIEGVVYMPAAVRHVQHGNPHSRLDTWLGVYSAATPGTDSGIESSVQIDLDNDPQPDVILRVLPEFGGQCRTNQEGYIEGVPDLVAEVAASSSSIDLNHKLSVYRRNGVQEYLVWKVLEEEVVWFRLEEGRFVERASESDVLHSAVFPGLRLDTAALVAGDMQRVLKVLQEGIETDEHGKFVDRLAQARQDLHGREQ